jgi:hypothetical protein
MSTTFMKDPKWDKNLFEEQNYKQTQVGTLLTTGFSAFTLDIQTGISWAFDIEIKGFKSPNSSTRSGLQIWWRIWSEKKSF